MRSAILRVLAAALLGAGGVAAPARAAEPGWMVVAPLAPGDALNIRAEPHGGAEIVGAVPPGALLSAGEARVMQGGTAWREVASGELHGWAAERFLAPARFRTLDQGFLPEAGTCGGFEPMWSFRWSADEVELSRMDAPAPRRRPVSRILLVEGRPYGLLEAGDDPADRLLFRYEDAICAELPVDGPLVGRGTLIITDDGATTVLSGCCRPSPEALAAP